MGWKVLTVALFIAVMVGLHYALKGALDLASDDFIYGLATGIVATSFIVWLCLGPLAEKSREPTE